MLRRLILHLGMGKAGSSTVQAFLKQNRPLLNREGFAVFCPAEVQPDPHRNLMDTPRFLKTLDAVEAGIAEQRAHSLIWSLEGFGTQQFCADPARLEALRRRFDAEHVRVVVYLRRQDTYAASAYLQWNVQHKFYNGPVRTFDELYPALYGEPPGSPIERTNLNFYDVVRPWANTFGASNVRVRPLERAQLADGDLLADFIAAAELPAAAYDTNIPPQNVTWPMEVMDLKGMYTSTFDGPVYASRMDGFFNSFGSDEYFSQPFFTRFELPPARRREIIAESEPFNARVAREFLGREDGVLFREPLPALDAPYRPYEGMTLERLVPVLLQVLVRQHSRINSLTRRVEALEGRMTEHNAAGHVNDE